MLLLPHFLFNGEKTRGHFHGRFEEAVQGYVGKQGIFRAPLPCASMAAETELLSWALSNHITDSAAGHSSCLGHTITIASFPHAGGRGLAASRDLKEGELILSVPELCLLNVRSAKEDETFMKALHDHPQQLSSTQILIAILLRETGKSASSRWLPYLKTLPRSYQTFMQFSRFETDALQVEDAVWAAEWSVEKANKEWEEAKPFLKSLGLKGCLITLKAWLWASSTVASRTLHVPWSSAGTLCPIGDLFNYAHGGPCGESMVDLCALSDVHVQKDAYHVAESQKVRLGEGNYDTGKVLQFRNRLADGGYDSDAKAYHFYAREDYEVGDQVLLCYGTYTNLELMEHYGFILSQNPNDKVPITLDMRNGNSSSEWLSITSSFPDGSVHIEADGRPSFLLLAALRLYCATAEVRKQRWHLAMCGQQLSVENDILSCEELRAKCSDLLERLPTTMEIDVALVHILSLCSSVEGLSGLIAFLRSQGPSCDCHNKLLDDSICGWADLSASDRQKVLDEVEAFLDSRRNLTVAESSKEANLQMERWWLSIKWRFCYKRILNRCIAFCDEQVHSLQEMLRS